MTNPMNHQGYLGNLEMMSTVEIRDLLHRQETLLKKPKFLDKLPDKGEKVKTFAKTLQNLLNSRERIQCNRVPQRERTDSGTSSGDDNKCATSKNQRGQKASSQSVFKTAKLSKSKQTAPQKPPLTEDIETLGGPDKNRDIVMLHAPSSPVVDEPSGILLGEKSNVSETTSHGISDLESTFGKMAVGDSVSMATEGEGHRMKHQFEIAEDRAERNKGILKPEHKPYSSLKIHNVKDLPEKFKPPEDLQSKGGKSHSAMEVSSSKVGEEEEKCSHVQHVGDGDSSATPPVYKFNETKLLSLQESLELQERQKTTQEELQAKLAAGRLAARLNVATEQYNPEGVDMSYRMKSPELDSDDEEIEDLSDVD